MMKLALAAALLAGVALPSAIQAQTSTPPASAAIKDMTELSSRTLASFEAHRRQYLQRAEREARRHQRSHSRPSGKVLGYVIGVGGFLGMGEHDIFVEPGKVKFVNEPARSVAAPAGNTKNTDSTMTTRPAANTTTGSAATRAANELWYPDHGVLSATKDQLKAIPQFKYSSYN